VIYPLVAFWICCVGYGWSIKYGVVLAVPLIFQLVLGCTTVCMMSSYQALLIDLHPGRSASAAASVRISFEPELIIVEYCAVLVRSWRRVNHAAYADETQCGGDVYSSFGVVVCCQCADDFGRETMGSEMAEREGGEVTEKEG